MRAGRRGRRTHRRYSLFRSHSRRRRPMQRRGQPINGRTGHSRRCGRDSRRPWPCRGPLVSYACTLAMYTFVTRSFRRYGASGVWVGTRFVASVEAAAPPTHKQLVLSAGHDDTVRTLVYSGRPMNVRKTAYVAEWEQKRQQEISELVSQGKIPHDVELERHPEKSLEGQRCKNAWISMCNFT